MQYRNKNGKKKLVVLDYEEEKARDFRKNPSLKKAYDDLEPLFETINEFIRLRNKGMITQKKLEELTRIPQSNISRFERGKSLRFSYGFLARLAKPLGYRPRIILEKIPL